MKNRLTFSSRTGPLHLKIWGLASDGQTFPLVEEDGKFVIAPGYPSAHEFTTVDGQIEFTFYSAGTAYQGTRVGE